MLLFAFWSWGNRMTLWLMTLGNPLGLWPFCEDHQSLADPACPKFQKLNNDNGLPQIDYLWVQKSNTGFVNCYCIHWKMLTKWSRNMQTCEDMLYKRWQFGANTSRLRARQILWFSCWDNFIIAALAFRPFFLSISTMWVSPNAFNASQNFRRSSSGLRSRMSSSFTTFASSVFSACWQQSQIQTR